MTTSNMPSLPPGVFGGAWPGRSPAPCTCPARPLTLPPVAPLAAVRGNLTLMVSEVSWAKKTRRDGDCCVAVKWWGEPGDGGFLWPTCTTKAAPTRRGATTIAYAVTAGPQQLASYLMDMRTLVLDVHTVAPGEPAPTPGCPPLGLAYLHLALAHFETPFCANLPVYDPSDVEVGELAVTLLVSFGVPTAQPSVAASYVSQPAFAHAMLGQSPSSDVLATTGVAPGHMGGMPWVCCGVGGGIGAGAGGAVAAGATSVASSFALNEKLAMFDASLPLLPAADYTVLNFDDGEGSRTARPRTAASQLPPAEPPPAVAPPFEDEGLESAFPPRTRAPPTRARSAQPQRPPATHPSSLASGMPAPSARRARTPHARGVRESQVRGVSEARGEAEHGAEALQATAGILARAQRLRAAMVQSSREACAFARTVGSVRAPPPSAVGATGAAGGGSATEAPSSGDVGLHPPIGGGQHAAAVAADLPDAALLVTAAPVAAAQRCTVAGTGSVAAGGPAPPFHDGVAAAPTSFQAAARSQGNPNARDGGVPYPTVSRSDASVRGGPSLSSLPQGEASPPASAAPPDATAVAPPPMLIELEVDRARIVDVAGAARPLNLYVVCRLCPLIRAASSHGEGAAGAAGGAGRARPMRGQAQSAAAAGAGEGGGDPAECTTFRGTRESDDVLRTDVCWGTATPVFGFRHRAPFSLPVPARPLHEAAAPADGGSAEGASSTGGHYGGRGRRQEMVLEVWAIDDTTQAEELVGLVRLLVSVPVHGARQRYATSVVEGTRPVINPFDITTRGELAMRLRVGTSAQLRASMRLRLAVSTIQVHWRRCRASRLRSVHKHLTQQRARLQQLPPPPPPPSEPPLPPAAPSSKPARAVRPSRSASPPISLSEQRGEGSLLAHAHASHAHAYASHAHAHTSHAHASHEGGRRVLTVEAPTSAWALAVRVGRIEGLRIPPALLLSGGTVDGRSSSKAGGALPHEGVGGAGGRRPATGATEAARLYVYYTLFKEGGVTDAIDGETERVMMDGVDRSDTEGLAEGGGEGVLCSPSFSHEYRATLRTSLSDDSFASFLQAQSASLEVWLAPPSATSVFSHILLGTATASLCGAQNGVQVTCGVVGASGCPHANGELRIGFCIGRGQCDLPLDLPKAIALPMGPSPPLPSCANGALACIDGPATEARAPRGWTSNGLLDHASHAQQPASHAQQPSGAGAIDDDAPRTRAVTGARAGADVVSAEAPAATEALGWGAATSVGVSHAAARAAELEATAMRVSGVDGPGDAPPRTELARLSGCMEELDAVHARLRARLNGADERGAPPSGLPTDGVQAEADGVRGALAAVGTGDVQAMGGASMGVAGCASERALSPAPSIISPWISPAGSLNTSPRASCVMSPRGSLSTSMSCTPANASDSAPGESPGRVEPCADVPMGGLTGTGAVASGGAVAPAGAAAARAGGKPRAFGERLDGILSDLRTQKDAPHHLGRIARILHGSPRSEADGDVGGGMGDEGRVAVAGSDGGGDGSDDATPNSAVHVRRGALALLFDSDSSDDDDFSRWQSQAVVAVEVSAAAGERAAPVRQ